MYYKLTYVLNILVAFIAMMINQSVSNGYVPKAFKVAVVTNILKEKSDLIPLILKNGLDSYQISPSYPKYWRK